MAWGTDKETVCFHGNPDELLDLITASIEVSGTAFLVYDDERAIEMQNMANNQKNFTRLEDVKELPFECLVKAGTMNNYNAHMARKEELQGGDGAYIFDVEQSPKFSKGGPLVPCLLKHGTLVSEDRVLTSSEHLLVMGEPFARDEYDLGTDLKCYINEALDDLTPNARKRIAGNSVCTDVQAAVAYYIMCNISLKMPSTAEVKKVASPSRATKKSRSPRRVMMDKDSFLRHAKEESDMRFDEALAEWEQHDAGTTSDSLAGSSTDRGGLGVFGSPLLPTTPDRIRVPICPSVFPPRNPVDESQSQNMTEEAAGIGANTEAREEPLRIAPNENKENEMLPPRSGMRANPGARYMPVPLGETQDTQPDSFYDTQLD